MTGQTLLNTMELLNQELQLQSGEADVTRGLLALNVAQDYFEARLARRPNTFGSSYGSFTQTSSQEFTAVPTGVLRIDSLWYLDPSTLRPQWKITPRFETGDHAPGMSWLAQLSANTPSGKPRAYWTNGASIWWDPLPDAANTVRWYGLQSAADITASGPFTYPDYTALPLAAFAVSVMKLGLDDDPSALASLATNNFDGVIDLMAQPQERSAVPLRYTYDHR